MNVKKGEVDKLVTPESLEYWAHKLPILNCYVVNRVYHAKLELLLISPSSLLSFNNFIAGCYEQLQIE